MTQPGPQVFVLSHASANALANAAPYVWALLVPHLEQIPLSRVRPIKEPADSEVEGEEEDEG